jgi:predicted nucleic acid-binding protein
MHIDSERQAYLRLTLIATNALNIEGTLVTNNVKEFVRVPKLKLENWFETI